MSDQLKEGTSRFPAPINSYNSLSFAGQQLVRTIPPKNVPVSAFLPSINKFNLYGIFIAFKCVRQAGVGVALSVWVFVVQEQTNTDKTLSVLLNYLYIWLLLFGRAVRCCASSKCRNELFVILMQRTTPKRIELGRRRCAARWWASQTCRRWSFIRIPKSHTDNKKINDA